MLTDQYTISGQRVFSLSKSCDDAKSPARGLVLRAVERLAALDGMEALYADICALGNDEPFLARSLKAMDVSLLVSEAELRHVPAKGPLVVVANHPFGAIEGVLLAELMRRVRPDCKVLANFLLSRVPELAQAMFYVDPYGGEGSAARNLATMRHSLRWLEKGGALALFPGGDVAHLDLRRRQVRESQWNTSVARLVAKTGATVVPIFFEGRNSWLFQAVGLIHPRLRTALLVRELLNKRGRRFTVRIGTPVPPRRLAAMGDDRKVTDYLRQRTLMLRYRGLSETAASATGRSDEIMAQQPAEVFAAEVERLPAECLLFESDGMRVYCQNGVKIPRLLEEIGRLREITYRTAGEGTGNALDVDSFDLWYDQLFIWNASTREVVGAYRLGRSDDILAECGVAGLYTSTLFNFRPQLLTKLGPALELGRSFVRREYQRSYAPLMLLWRGIGSYVCRNPRYRMLFGPVSISNEYQSVSRQLMVEFLQRRHLNAALTPLARPRNPFRRARLSNCDDNSLENLLGGGDDLGDVVAELEPDQKGVPVLLRQYLKLGAKFFAFNVDANFNDAVDALMYVDLTCTDRRTLDRYLTPAGARAFLAHHGVAAVPRRGETMAVN